MQKRCFRNMITHLYKNILPRLIIILLILSVTTNVLYSAEYEEYKIQAGDVLLITVYEQPDLTTKGRVGSKGHITFPLLGTVQVNGLSINAIEQKLELLLEKDYLVNPQVNVFIEKYHPEKVFVMGFVNKPGEYELSKDRPNTVLEAITMAGGFKEGAAKNKTKIIRVEDGKEVTIPIKVTDITNKGNKEKDVPVKPDDIIVVPESFF